MLTTCFQIRQQTGNKQCERMLISAFFRRGFPLDVLHAVATKCSKYCDWLSTLELRFGAIVLVFANVNSFAWSILCTSDQFLHIFFSLWTLVGLIYIIGPSQFNVKCFFWILHTETRSKISLHFEQASYPKNKRVCIFRLRLNGSTFTNRTFLSTNEYK